MEYINRSLSEILENTPKDKATIIFGPRQVGKTTLLEHFIKNRDCFWLSGDEPVDVNILTNLPSKKEVLSLLSSHKIIVIDEAQKIPGIGLLIKRMVDARTECKIYVTGSSSLDLAGGVYESAAGRTRSYYLWPFSFEELADASSVIQEKRNLSSRLVFGSYPQIINKPSQAIVNLNNLYKNLAFKDALALGGIKNHGAFQHLVYVLASPIGQMCSYESIAQECKLSSPTVRTYITLLEQCFVIKCLPSFARNLENELKKSKKIYFYDLGVRNAILKRFTPLESRPFEEQGALFENYFVIERIKQASYHNCMVNHYFWRTKNKAEVDLIETYNDEIQAFEIKLSRDDVMSPPSFREAYPEAKYTVVNKNNYQNYLSHWDLPIIV